MSTTPTAEERYFVSAVTVDDDDVGHITPTTVVADGDDRVTVTSKLGSLQTSNDVQQHIELFDVSNDDVQAVDIEVTVGPAANCARFKLSALVKGVGSTATLVGSVDSDVKPSSTTLAATLTVSGAKVRLSVTGLAATTLSWGYEARAQRQVP